MSAALAQLDELTAALRERVDDWCRQVGQTMRYIESPAGLHGPAASAAPPRRAWARPSHPAAGEPTDSSAARRPHVPRRRRAAEVTAGAGRAPAEGENR